MPFGKRASRCCCDPVVSPCKCTGDFDDFQVVITGMADVDCSGNATLFNGTHTIGRGDNYPVLSHTCFGRKGFGLAEYSEQGCSYGVPFCSQVSSSTSSCFSSGSNPIGPGCGFIDCRVRTSPTAPSTNFLLQVSCSTWHISNGDNAVEYWIWEADIPIVACTSVVNQSLTLVDERTLSDIGVWCVGEYPIEWHYPCNDCNSMSSATVKVTLL